MKARATPTQFLLVDDAGTEHAITTHRSTLWKQGIVILPNTLRAPGAAAMADPADEDSNLNLLDDAIHAPELARLQAAWAADELDDGDTDLPGLAISPV